jgi:hypothetical protein
MYSNFCDFYFVNHAVRWRAYLIVTLLVFGFGSFNVLVLHRLEKEVTLEALGLLCLLTLASPILWSWRNRELAPARKSLQGAPKTLYRFRRPVLVGSGAILSALILVASNLLTQKKIESVGLGYRLCWSANPRTLGLLGSRETSAYVKMKLQEAQNILSAAKRNGTVIQPDLLDRAGQSLIDKAKTSPEVSSLAWQTALQTVGYRSFVNAQLSLAPPIPNANISKAPAGKRPTAIEIGPMLYVEVSNSIIVGFQQTLDRGVWRNVEFRNCLIRYNGGPVTLENVHFQNCEFEFPLTLASTQLAQGILGSASVFMIVPQPSG